MNRKGRRVVCAAIRNRDGKIVCGARHWDIVMRAQTLVDGQRPPEWHSAEQGFIDQNGNFMNRQEAWRVAVEAGQVNVTEASKEHPPGTLYSEDIY